MGLYMNSIVEKLSEIENAAVAIVDHAEAGKASVEREWQEKRDRFDARLEQKTQAELSAIRSGLEMKMKKVLSEQEAANKAAIIALKQDYEARHSFYAKKILRHIIEV